MDVKNIFRRAIALSLLLGLADLSACSSSHSSLKVVALPKAEPAPAPRKLSATPPPVKTIVQIVELRGDPAEMGAEHGRQCGPAIHLLYDKYLNVAVQGAARFQASVAAALFEAQMLPEHRDEMLALAGETGIQPIDVALAQCFLDLSPGILCSTVTLPASASPDGVARFGRNLDFPSLDIADKHSVVFIYHPRGRYQFAAVSWPGLIGVLSGMNEHGLCLANMEVERTVRTPSAMPYILLYRAVLEQCRTVDEAIDLLQRTPRQSANNLMLMDASGNRAVAEIRPEGVVIRRGDEKSALISTNHQRGQDSATAGLCWRYDLLHEASAAQFGKIDALALQRLLGEVVQGNQGDMTLQSMVFEPANRVIYLAVGSDAPTHPYERIDLKTYFNENPVSSAGER
jgi:hypothetical protein